MEHGIQYFPNFLVKVTKEEGKKGISLNVIGHVFWPFFFFVKRENQYSFS